MKVPPGHVCRIDKRICLTILSKFHSFYKMLQMGEKIFYVQINPEL